MSKIKSWLKKAKNISFVLTGFFILTIVALFVLSIIFTVLSNPKIEPKEGAVMIDWFSTQVSNSYGMNIPFSIFIQLVTSIGGVFLGIRIGQWIDEKEEREKLVELWKKIHIFLNALNSGINDNKSIYELYEYKVYWESLQRADTIATKLLQEDEKYTEVYLVFSFLTCYKEKWSLYENIHQWEINSAVAERKRIFEWKKNIIDLIKYSEKKYQ